VYVLPGTGALSEPLSGRSFPPLQCRQLILRRARFLLDQGVRRGDRVFVHYGNCAEFFFDVAAIWMVGAAAAPVDPRLTPFEIGVLVDAVRPRFASWDKEPDAAVVAIAEAHGTRFLRHDQYADDHDGVLASGLPLLDDDALLLFTSGTTGSPKAVAHTHRSLRSRFVSFADSHDPLDWQRTLCLTPTNFAWGLLGNGLFPWLWGRDLCIVPAFRADLLMQLGRLCDEHGITHLPTVPAMWPIVLRAAASPQSGSLRRVGVGTGPLGKGLWQDIQRWSGVRNVVTVYAMTECGWITSATGAESEPEDGLVGRASGAIVRILPRDPAGGSPLLAEPCAVDVAGTVWVQTPSLMRGYLGQEDLTRQVVHHGWFNTGDIGAMDGNGVLRLSGREKEMINAGGVKVYPADVDRALMEQGLAADVCTFAQAHAVHGEQVAVAIVLREPGMAALGEVYRRAAERLATYQLPKAWFVVGEIPRTARGKLSRTDVAAMCRGLTAVDPRSALVQRDPAA
jgi:acyl-CoA synthetase (AMP-forming)/AMP-acid ligase II